MMRTKRGIAPFLVVGTAVAIATIISLFAYYQIAGQDKVIVKPNTFASALYITYWYLMLNKTGFEVEPREVVINVLDINKKLDKSVCENPQEYIGQYIISYTARTFTTDIWREISKYYKFLEPPLQEVYQQLSKKVLHKYTIVYKKHTLKKELLVPQSNIEDTNVVRDFIDTVASEIALFYVVKCFEAKSAGIKLPQSCKGTQYSIYEYIKNKVKESLQMYSEGSVYYFLPLGLKEIPLPLKERVVSWEDTIDVKTLSEIILRYSICLQNKTLCTPLQLKAIEKLNNIFYDIYSIDVQLSKIEPQQVSPLYYNAVSSYCTALQLLEVAKDVRTFVPAHLVQFVIQGETTNITVGGTTNIVGLGAYRYEEIRNRLKWVENPTVYEALNNAHTVFSLLYSIKNVTNRVCSLPKEFPDRFELVDSKRYDIRVLKYEHGVVKLVDVTIIVCDVRLKKVSDLVRFLKGKYSEIQGVLGILYKWQNKVCDFGVVKYGDVYYTQEYPILNFAIKLVKYSSNIPKESTPLEICIYLEKMSPKTVTEGVCTNYPECFTSVSTLQNCIVKEYEDLLEKVRKLDREVVDILNTRYTFSNERFAELVKLLYSDYKCTTITDQDVKNVELIEDTYTKQPFAMYSYVVDRWEGAKKVLSVFNESACNVVQYLRELKEKVERIIKGEDTIYCTNLVTIKVKEVPNSAYILQWKDNKVQLVLPSTIYTSVISISPKEIPLKKEYPLIRELSREYKKVSTETPLGTILIEGKYLRYLLTKIPMKGTYSVNVSTLATQTIRPSEDRKYYIQIKGPIIILYEDNIENVQFDTPTNLDKIVLIRSYRPMIYVDGVLVTCQKQGSNYVCDVDERAPTSVVSVHTIVPVGNVTVEYSNTTIIKYGDSFAVKQTIKVQGTCKVGTFTIEGFSLVPEVLEVISQPKDAVLKIKLVGGTAYLTGTIKCPTSFNYTYEVLVRDPEKLYKYIYSLIDIKGLKDYLEKLEVPVELKDAYKEILSKLKDVEVLVKDSYILYEQGRYDEALDNLMKAYKEYLKLRIALEDVDKRVSNAMVLLADIDDLSKVIQLLSTLDKLKMELPTEKDIEEARKCVIKFVIGEVPLTECQSKIEKISKQIDFAKKKLIEYAGKVAEELKEVLNYTHTNYLGRVLALSSYCPTKSFKQVIEKVQEYLSEIDKCITVQDVETCVKSLSTIEIYSIPDIDTKYNTFITSCINKFEEERSQVLLKLNKTIEKVEDLLKVLSRQKIDEDLKNKCITRLGREKCTNIIYSLIKRYKKFSPYVEKLEGFREELKKLYKRVLELKAREDTLKQDYDVLSTVKDTIENIEDKVLEIEQEVEKEKERLESLLGQIPPEYRDYASKLLNEYKFADFVLYVNMIKFNTTGGTPKQGSTSLFIVYVILLLVASAGAGIYILKWKYPEKYEQLVQRINKVLERLRRKKEGDTGEEHFEGEFGAL